MKLDIWVTPWTGDHASRAGEESGALFIRRVAVKDIVVLDQASGKRTDECVLRLDGFATLDLQGAPAALLDLLTDDDVLMGSDPAGGRLLLNVTEIVVHEDAS